MTLFQTFVDASEAERARYTLVEQEGWGFVRCGQETASLCTGTRAECTRWIVEQAARKGFEAIEAVVSVWTDAHEDVQDYVENVLNFLHVLAAEPETTSGDAG